MLHWLYRDLRESFDSRFLPSDAVATENKTKERATATWRPVFYLASLAALGAGYYFSAKLGLRLAFHHRSATPVWPPTGIALAALVLGGARLWPAVAAGAFLANLTTSGDPWSSIGIAAGNTLEAVVASVLVRRFARGRDAFDRTSDIFRWTVFAGLLATALSATVGVASLRARELVSAADAPAVWLTWALGDAGGALLMAPFLVLWLRRPPAGGSPLRPLEALALGTLLWVLAETCFGVPIGFAGNGYPLAFAFFSLLGWAAFRLGQRATITVAVAISVVAVWGTLLGNGPFAVGDPNQSLLLVQAFLAVMTTTALGLAAAVEERRRAQKDVADLNADLERRVAERTAEMGKSQTMLAQAESVAHLGSWEWDVPANALRWSEELYRVYGVRPGSFAATYESFLERVHPEDRERVRAVVEKAFADRRPFEIYHRIVRPDGRVRILHARGEVAADAAGRPVRMFGTGQDVTEEKELERQAQLAIENERLYAQAQRESEGQRFLAEAGEKLAASLDYQSCLENVVRFFVPRMADLGTIQVRESEGAPPRTAAWSHAAPEKGKLFLELDRFPRSPDATAAKAFRTGEPQLLPDVEPELPRLAAGGPEHFRALEKMGFRSAIAVPLVARGRTLGVITLATTDDSGRRLGDRDLALAREVARRAALVIDNAQLYQALQDFNRILELRVSERTAELKDAVAELEGFSYTVAHDLRAPLRALASFSGILQEEYGPRLDEGGREYLDRISKAAQRMDDLVQDLLSYSKLSREEVRLESVSLDALAREVVTLMESELRERRAAVRIEGPLPPVLGHRVMLGQAISNLVGNAVKFVAPGVDPLVRILAENRGGRVRLWVEDNGIGIPSQYHQTIFEIFQRLEPGRFPGTGIGLAIVRKALARMGGESGVESMPGQGSRFWIEAPAAEGDHGSRVHRALGRGQPGRPADPRAGLPTVGPGGDAAERR